MSVCTHVCCRNRLVQTEPFSHILNVRALKGIRVHEALTDGCTEEMQCNACTHISGSGTGRQVLPYTVTTIDKSH